MMLLIPLSGYVISTSSGDAVVLFGGVAVPALFTISESARDLAIAVHYYCAYGTVALVMLHAAAALLHQFVKRDGTLRRMLW